MLNSLIRISLTILTLYGLTGSGIAFAAQAPDFKLDGQQKQIQLSDYRGKIVYLDFWASWCQPCRKSFSWMNKMQSLYGKEGFKVIAINLDESRANADKFLKRVPADFDIAFDPRGDTAETYKVRAMPSSYIIDKQGKLVHANLGFHSNDEDKLEEKIRNLLRQSTLASR
ncbi:MAG: redoxin domain-containing protein [Gammaproteobacteria bacterium]|nr:redoxin domain-containing protein [Gammaproteobacteria bacterium]